MMFKQAVGLDVTRGGLETDRTFIEAVVDIDVSEIPVLEAGFIITGMIVGKGYIMITICPPNFSASDGDLFLLSQGG